MFPVVYSIFVLSSEFKIKIELPTNIEFHVSSKKQCLKTWKVTLSVTALEISLKGKSFSETVVYIFETRYKLSKQNFLK